MGINKDPGVRIKKMIVTTERKEAEEFVCDRAFYTPFGSVLQGPVYRACLGARPDPFPYVFSSFRTPTYVMKCGHDDNVHEGGYRVCQVCGLCDEDCVISSSKCFNVVRTRVTSKYCRMQYFEPQMKKLTGVPQDVVCTRVRAVLGTLETPDWTKVYAALKEEDMICDFFSVPAVYGHPLVVGHDFGTLYSIANDIHPSRKCFNMVYLLVKYAEMHGRSTEWIPLQVGKRTIKILDEAWMRICDTTGYDFYPTCVSHAKR